MSRRERTVRACQCGCGREVYANRLTEVTIDQALDKTLRISRTRKRFWVTRECKEAFEEELGMLHLLEQLARAWAPVPRSQWWLINFWLNPLYPWPRVFWSYCRRIRAGRRVMQLQHAIYERNKGFQYARARAIQSLIMFASPRFLQNFLARRFIGRLKRIEDARATGLATLEVVAKAAQAQVG